MALNAAQKRFIDKLTSPKTMLHMRLVAQRVEVDIRCNELLKMGCTWEHVEEFRDKMYKLITKAYKDSLAKIEESQN